MAKRGHIPIEKEELPIEFEIELGGQDFFFGVNHNASQDIFTVDLWTIERKPLVIGERMILNERLWADIINVDLPSIDLVPMDESGAAKKLTYENFGNTVFLYVDDLPPESDIPKLENEGSL